MQPLALSTAVGNKVTKTACTSCWEQLKQKVHRLTSWEEKKKRKKNPLGYPVYTAVPGSGGQSSLAPQAHSASSSGSHYKTTRSAAGKGNGANPLTTSQLCLARLCCCLFTCYAQNTTTRQSNKQTRNNFCLCERKATVNVYPRIERLLAAVGYKLPKLTVVCCEKLASPQPSADGVLDTDYPLWNRRVWRSGVYWSGCAALTNTCAKYQQHRETETLRLASGLTSQWL